MCNSISQYVLEIELSGSVWGQREGEAIDMMLVSITKISFFIFISRSILDGHSTRSMTLSSSHRTKSEREKATWCVRCVWKSIILIYFSLSPLFFLFVGRCIRQQWTKSDSLVVAFYIFRRCRQNKSTKIEKQECF